VTQGGHISTEPRINERIRVPEVRLVGPAGEQVGIVAINDALALAQEADLDLVEVAPTARPPVCKLMDYGKFKYESALKARESRKNQAQTVIKEIKLRPKIDPHDYGTKKGHVERFLKQGDKVKVTIMFRGREQSRPELGHRLLQRLASDVEELGFVEAQPKLDGRNMIMVIGPTKRKTDQKADRSPTRASARATVAREGAAAHAEEAALAEEAAHAEEAANAEEAPAVAPRESAVPSAGQPPAATPDEGAAGQPPAATPDEGAAGQVAAAPAGQPPAEESPAVSRPAGPRPGPAAAAPAAPRPAPAVRRPAPAAPRSAPAAPRPASGSPRPAPAAPRPASGAPRPAPAAPRPASAAPRPVPTAPRPVPTPRAPRPAAAAADRGVGDPPAGS
jgi:translation initiation factor IF-3